MSAEPVSAELRQVLRDLKLSGVLDTLPERVELARQAHLPYPEFLTVILADEVARRERVSTTVRARAARLDATMTLEGWDDTTEAVFDRDLWAELCTLRFVEARRDLIVMGPVGVGKTFMASALGHIACRRRFTTLAGRCDQILKRLRGSRLDGSHDLELRKLIRVEVLLFDDFCLQALDAADTADIYEIIVERHRRATTIVTTNREPPGEWFAAMADPLLAESAIDRLTSNAYQLVVDGPSYRQRQRPGRAGQEGPAPGRGQNHYPELRAPPPPASRPSPPGGLRPALTPAQRDNQNEPVDPTPPTGRSSTTRQVMAREAVPCSWQTGGPITVASDSTKSDVQGHTCPPRSRRDDDRRCRCLRGLWLLSQFHATPLRT